MIQLSDKVFYGIYPREDVSKGLSYIISDMPEGNKKVLCVDSRATANRNGFSEIIDQIEVDFSKNRLLIVEKE
jgi:hypothetical protein